MLKATGQETWCYLEFCPYTYQGVQAIWKGDI